MLLIYVKCHFAGDKTAVKREQKSLFILPSVSSFAPFQGAKVQKK